MWSVFPTKNCDKMAVMYTCVGGYINFDLLICQIAENQSDLEYHGAHLVCMEYWGTHLVGMEYRGMYLVGME